jgi:hypothetical protein
MPCCPLSYDGLLAYLSPLGRGLRAVLLAGVDLVPALTYLQPPGSDGPLWAVDRLTVGVGDEPETPAGVWRLRRTVVWGVHRSSLAKGRRAQHGGVDNIEEAEPPLIGVRGRELRHGKLRPGRVREW